MTRDRYHPDLTPVLGSPGATLVLCLLLDKAGRFFRKKHKAEFWLCVAPPSICPGESREEYLRRTRRRYSFVGDSFCEETGLSARDIRKALQAVSVSTAEESQALLAEPVSEDSVQTWVSRLRASIVARRGQRSVKKFYINLPLLEESVRNILRLEAQRKARLFRDEPKPEEPEELPPQKLFLDGAFWGGDVDVLADELGTYIRQERTDYVLTEAEIRALVGWFLEWQAVRYAKEQKRPESWNGAEVYHAVLGFGQRRYGDPKKSKLHIDFLRYDHVQHVICTHLNLRHHPSSGSKVADRNKYEQTKELSYRLRQEGMDLLQYLQLFRAEAQERRLTISYELAISPNIVSRILSNRRVLEEKVLEEENE